MNALRVKPIGLCLMALVLGLAPERPQAQGTPPAHGSATAGKRSAASAMGFPSSMFGEEFALLYDDSLRTVYDKETRTMVELVARRKVRLISDEFQVSCELLEYNGEEGKMTAHPALGKRVQVTLQGVRAECGLLEYYPDKGKAVLSRRPVIFQRDESGRESETGGHIITITRKESGEPDILVQGKSDNPATVIMDMESQRIGKRVRVVNERPETPATDTDRATSQTAPGREGRPAAPSGRIQTDQDVMNIPADIRSPEEDRPR